MGAPQDPTDLTLAYYAQNAEAFASSTADVDFAATQARFEALLAPGARVLDFGCGSGRDAKHFVEAGFDVVATDGSPELCRIAEQRAGIPVRNERFEDLREVEAYDGIWACSSILHLPKRELADVLSKMRTALRPRGVIYTSFKHGTFEGVRNGRYFCDFTLPDFCALLEQVGQLQVEDSWVTGDVRPGRESEQWLNLLLRKL